MRIAVDLDDVVLDFFQGCIDSMRVEFGADINKADCKTWDAPGNAVKAFPWKRYGYKSYWDWMERRDWIWTTFKAIPGAIGGVNRLRSQGHYLECLTAKPDWAEWCVWKWLGRWRPPFNQVTIVGMKSDKPSSSDARVLVDDKPENVMSWVDSREDRVGILFDQPWNQDLPDQDRIARAFSWDDVVRGIEHIVWMEEQGLVRN